MMRAKIQKLRPDDMLHALRTEAIEMIEQCWDTDTLDLIYKILLTSAPAPNDREAAVMEMPTERKAAA